MSTLLDPGQAIKHAYDDASQSFKVIGAGGTLVTEAFDYVGAAYPNDTTEVYTYKAGGSGGTIVATVTVVYTTNVKDYLESVTRT